MMFSKAEKEALAAQKRALDERRRRAPKPPRAAAPEILEAVPVKSAEEQFVELGFMGKVKALLMHRFGVRS